MENTLELVTKFGLGIALSIVLAYLLGLIIKWMLGEFTRELKELKEIIVKLIDRINRLDDDVSAMAGKMQFERREMRDGE